RPRASAPPPLNCTTPAFISPSTSSSDPSSSLEARRLATGFFILSHVTRILIGGESHGAGLHPLANQTLHLCDLLRRRFALDGVLAHDVVTHRDMADEGGNIDAEASSENVEIFFGGSPLPLEAFLQHAATYRLDADEAFDHGLAILGLRRRQAQTTVADHDRSDTVKARRGSQRIPKQLSVEMRVRIYETRRQGQAIHSERLSCGALDPPDLDDFSTRHGDIAVETRHTRSVINPSASKHEIVHLSSPFFHAMKTPKPATAGNYIRINQNLDEVTERGQAIAVRFTA